MTDALRVMIVDDEEPAREGMRIRLRREAGVTIVGEFGDASQALDAIRADVPDVLFLDVQMPRLDGFALLERLGPARPIVIFVTAHEQHALAAFGVRALDFVLKPVEQERLRAALEHARQQLRLVRNGELADRMRELVARPDAPHGPGSGGVTGADRRIAVRADGVIRFVEAQDIDWIEAAGDGVRLHVAKAVHGLRQSLGELLAALPPGQFLRIHRSTIVNVHRVRELQPWFHGEYIVVLRDGTKLKLSRSYRTAITGLTGTLG